MKLDKKDFKLLYELDKNSRLSYSQLSKKVKLSQESVRYRINKLIREGVINKFFTVIDISKLGFTFYKILIKLHNVNEEKMKKIIDSLSKKEKVVWLTSLDGGYDIGLVIKAKDILELNLFLEELDSKYSSYISKRVFSVNIRGEYLYRDYLVNNKRSLEPKFSYTVESKKEKVDEKDLTIIKELTKDARINSVEIAGKLKISPDNVLQRKKKLETKNIINRYNIILNNHKLNQIHYKVLIYLNNFSPKMIYEFINFCKSINRVVYIIKTLGGWSYELDIEVENIEQYRKIMMDITNRFSSIINDYDTLIIRRIYKYNLYP
jgi:DNA-binding Lrp family transcriptional regulator